MFYIKNIRCRRENKNKNKINVWLIAIILTLAIFLNAQNIQEVKASGITSGKLVELTNQSRAEQGIEKLTINQNLISAANSKARDMFEHNYFAHTSPQKITPWNWIRQAGYSYQYAGENLAMDFVTSEAIHKALIASATHRKNILNANYKEIGIAVLSGNFEDRQTTIIVQMFGAAVQTVKKQKSKTDSNPPVIKNPTVASASTDINKFPVAAKKINKPAIPNNDLVELNKKELVPLSVLPVEADKIESDEKLSFSVIPAPSVIPAKAGIQYFNPSLFIWIPNQACLSGRQVGNDKIHSIPILEINSNGRIKNAFKNDERDFIARQNFVIPNLFRDLSQDFDYHISRFRNKFGMTDKFFFEIPEYLSCFLLGRKIDAYMK